MNRTEHELELMRRYLEGVASLEETQELESLIVKDASVRQDFLRYTHLDSALAGVRRSQPVGDPRRSVWLSWRPLTAAAAGIAFGMFCTSVVFGYVMPRAVAAASLLSALVDGSFETLRGPLPSGFPTEFGVWSGEETELVEGGRVRALEGKRMLRFVRSSEFPAMGNSCDVYQLIDLRALGISQQDGESALELSARFLDGRAAGGDPVRFILRLYVFSGSPDSLREKWPLTWRNAMTLPEALSTGNTLLQSGGTRPDDWREVKAKALLPPNAEFALVHVGVYSPRAPNSVPLEFGSQFVDDVRLTLTTQPVLPVRVVQR